jgi:hypothetical protein
MKGRAMEICINKCSNKYFIFVQNIEDGKRLLITPFGEIKTLEERHFLEPIDEDEYLLLSEGLITKQQYEAYQIYKRNRGHEQVEGFMFIFENLDPWHQQRFLHDLRKRVGGENT